MVQPTALDNATVQYIVGQGATVALAIIGWARARQAGRARDEAQKGTRQLLSALHRDPDVPAEKVRELSKVAGLQKRATDELSFPNGNHG